MIRCDALVVGGGPAGSTCARELRKAGWDVVVADRARFPRDKVCAGWLTPAVFTLLELDPAEYRDAGLTLQEISAFRTGVIGRPLVETRYRRTISYAIRRCQFDEFLLRRSGARLIEGRSIDTLRRAGDMWIANDEIAAPIVIGAGGHFCPVARHLRGGGDIASPVVAKETEFRFDVRRARLAHDTPELFFCRDLEGYGWCMPKGDYLNVGFGRRENHDFTHHLNAFVAFLQRSAGVACAGERWRGHAYLASGAGHRPIVGPGMLLLGDAAGLAYPESGEGIRPAVASGRLAALALADSGGRDVAPALQRYADAVRRLHPCRPSQPAAIRAATATLGRVLLGSPMFTRHVVLDRWFLRTAHDR